MRRSTGAVPLGRRPCDDAPFARRHAPGPTS